MWRDRGEPATELNNVQECWDHAFQGGLRKSNFFSRYAVEGLTRLFVGAGSLAFGIRSGVNLFLLLFRILKIPK